MKKIEAYIKAHRLHEVVENLHEIEGLTGVSIHDMQGFGRVRGQDEPVRIVDNAVNGIPHVKIELFCTTAIKDRVVAAIIKGAHTGLRGDGKIYVSPVEEAIRISTGERDEAAV